jgi:hypothetical protein
VGAFLRRAAAASGGTDVVLLADGQPDPVLMLPLPDAGDAGALERLADELAGAIADDASASRSSRYRVIIQRGDETLSTLALRVRTDAADHPIDASLRRAAETREDAVIRQLMRHQESMVRLMLERDARRAESDARREDRIAARLEELERKNAESADRRIELVRVEAEIARDLAREERAAALQSAAVQSFAPAAARLAGAWTARALPAPAPAASPTSPSLSSSSSSSSSSHGARLLEVVGRLDVEAVEALAAFLSDEDARALRQAAAAARQNLDPVHRDA